MKRRRLSIRADDIRFTSRDNLLYATFLGWPEEKAVISFDQDPKSNFKTIKLLEPGEIESVKMLGIDKELNWSMTRKGLEIDVPNEKPCDNAYVFKITRKEPF